MRNVFKFLIPGVLIACSVAAQESESSLETILNELNTYNNRASSAPAVVLPEAEQAEQDIDVQSTLDHSRDLYVGGEFERAQKGFEAIIKIDPENVVARMYLRRILERNHRKTEIAAMDAVDDAWKTGLMLRSYSISSDAVQKMELGDVTEATDITFKFPEVSFPKGASAIYQPKTTKLFVRATRQNFAVLEEILDALDINKYSTDVDQVEIEAKFVEVMEGTLEALGFQWDFQDIVRTGIEGSDIWFDDGNGLFADALRGGANVNSALPFSRPADIAGDTPATGAWSSSRLEDTFSQTAAVLKLENNGSNPLEVLISALDQSSGTDVLSAPRVVTKSGETAKIRVGEIHYFPEIYEVGANEGNIVHVKYEDFAEKLLGVELEVTPKIDGDQISLGLNPKINELRGWQNYTIAPANSAYTYYQFRVGFEFEHDAVIAKLPVFKKREIKTEVTIADGSTIGMGGLINEKIESYKDKVPFLGSLPGVGRLFRNEGQRAVKQNLMIFVTAKKVNPSGRINTARSFE
ncbi:MAG: hypothetical protein WC959_01720 [Kiritimatiellales bacterium]